MQKTIFQCDQCGKEIGRNKHLSLIIDVNNSYCGVALPPFTADQRWQVYDIPGKPFKHFCTPKCLAAFFSDLMKSATRS